METKATFEAVKDAFEKLARAGKPTSNRAVQAITGGSLTTVGEHLSKIREDLVSAHPRAKMPPDLLTELLAPIALRIWERAELEQAKSFEERFSYQVSAQMGLTEEKRDLILKAEELETELLAAKSGLDHLEGAIADERDRIDTLAKTLEASRQELEATRQALEIERIARKSADQSAADLRSSNEQFQELINMLKGMQTNKSDDR